MKLNLFILIFFFLRSLVFYAQAPEIEWQNTIGAYQNDLLQCLDKVNSNEYILGGYSNSTNTGDKTDVGNGNDDYWILLIDSTGAITWQNTIGGSDDDRLYRVMQTIDGGFILGGYSSSPVSGDKTESTYGFNDYWVIKLDSLGEIEWQNNIGGLFDDQLYITKSCDGGYIVGGSSSSDSSFDKIYSSFGSYDYWILKLTEDGNILWQKTFGGSSDDFLQSIVATADEGYILGGYSNSEVSGNKTTENLGGYDYWVIKIDSIGSLIWQKTIGGNSDDKLTVLSQDLSGRYLVGGYSNSDISGDKLENTIGTLGYPDYWVLEIDTIGTILWQNTIGGDNGDILTTASQTSDLEYIIGGYSYSGVSGDKTDSNRGNSDYWILKLSDIGEVLWQKTIGGNSFDNLYCLQQTSDDGFIIGGASNSQLSGDKTEDNIGTSVSYADYWVVKLYPEDCTPLLFYEDNDGDGYGNIDFSIMSCDTPDAFVMNNLDCDDSNASIHPGITEICNALDDNCNTTVDEDLPAFIYYSDADSDGFGISSDSITICEDIPPMGYSVNDIDCNDTDPLINPFSNEVCNNTDDNCNEDIDEGLAEYFLYLDSDGDGFGYSASDTATCYPDIPGFVSDSSDCDDTNPYVNPLSNEIANGIDDNCNDTIDEGYTVVENIIKEYFEVYPNPNNGILKLDFFNTHFENALLEIYDLQNQRLFYKFIESDKSLTVQLPDKISGTVQLKISCDSWVYSTLIYIIK